MILVSTCPADHEKSLYEVDTLVPADEDDELIEELLELDAILDELDNDEREEDPKDEDEPEE